MSSSTENMEYEYASLFEENKKLMDMINDLKKKLQQQEDDLQQKNTEMDVFGKEFQKLIQEKQEKDEDIKNLREQWEKDKEKWNEKLDDEIIRSRERIKKLKNEIKVDRKSVV